MRHTLQNRIAATMILSVAVLICAFCFIQLQSQLRNIAMFNSLKAKLAAQMLKDSAERALREGPPGEGPAELLSYALDSLQRSGLIGNAYIYSAKGVIAASTHPLDVGIIASKEESFRINWAVKSAKRSKAFNSFVDKAARTLELYIPIFAKGEVGYVGRLEIPLGNIAEAMKQVYIPVVFTGAVVIIINIIFAVVLSKRVIGPISLLNQATKEITGGDFNLRIHISTKDELEELADRFNVMAVELKKMKERAENANPLTKLAGNIVIREEIERRIKNNQKFTVIYCDIDNFKAFNDKYGIQAGDDAIRLTASILKEAVAQRGTAEDFVGHEGGDDFLVFTTPEKAEEIGNDIMAQFDKRIRTLYNEEDRERGYILARTRRGDQILKFPVMTISLAGVTNRIRAITSYGQVTNIAAEVKKKVKESPASSFLIDRRTS